MTNKMESLIIEGNIKLSPEDLINKLINIFGYGAKDYDNGACFVKNGAVYRLKERGYGEISWHDVLVTKNKNSVKELEALLYLKERIKVRNTLELEQEERFEVRKILTNPTELKSLSIRTYIKIHPEDAINKLTYMLGHGEKGYDNSAPFIRNGAIYITKERGCREIGWHDVLVTENKNSVKELEALLYLKERIEARKALELEDENELEL